MVDLERSNRKKFQFETLQVSSLMGPKMNDRQQRHVGALGATPGETQVRGSPRAHTGTTPAHLCGTRRG